MINKYIHVTIDDNYEIVVQNTNEDLLILDKSYKDIILEENYQHISHDIYFKTHPSFDHYGESDVENHEEIALFPSKVCGCNGTSDDSCGFESQEYSKGDQVNHGLIKRA
jgi:hypothetical protein